MATENPLRLLGSTDAGNWPVSKDTATFSPSTGSVAAEELGFLFKGHKYDSNRKTAGPSRSGSAPPSVEGSRAAFDILKDLQTSYVDASLENLGNTFGDSELEDQSRAHPAYLAYYCSNVNLNPRLPPPLTSRENRHLMHHIGGFGDSWRMPSFDDSSKASLFISRPTLSTHKEEPEDDKSPRLATNNWQDKNVDIIPGQFTSPLRARHKSLVDLIQEDFPRTPSPVYNNQACSSSRRMEETAADSDGCVNIVHDSSNPELKTFTVGGRACTPIPAVHSINSISNGDLAAVSVSSSTSSSRTVSPHSSLRGGSSSDDTNLDRGIVPSGLAGSNIGSIKDEINSLKISNDGHRNQHARQRPQQIGLDAQALSQAQIDQSQMMHQGMHRSPADHSSHGQSKSSSVEVQPVLQSTGITPPLYASAAAYGTPYYPNLQTSSLFPPQFGISGYAFNTPVMPPLMTSYPSHSAIPVPFDSPGSPNFSARASGVATGGNIVPGVDLQHFYKIYGQLGVAVQPTFPDPLYVPYFQHPSVDTYAGAGSYDAMVSRGNAIGNTLVNYDPHKGRPSFSSYSPDQRQIVSTGGVSASTARKGGTVGPNYYGSPPNIGVLMPYPTSPLASPVYQGSPVAGTNFSGRRNDNTRLPFSSGRAAGSCSGWQGQREREKADDTKSYSFLEELKSSKARRYELSDIAGRIVEFSSADQHGSRFIQQKLETCSMEEKASVFKEVLPHASTLMIDVFGNYVIQKFFEHGSSEQRKELANKLAGHILPLSLQMYGCRVIQKALEVIDLDQKTQLVQELDGHVMRCVRDQNGNHVIQKCIECVPTGKIGFIISAFRGQVATLSMHPYGCRVIQRVLEHCTDDSQSQCIVDEILQSACQLAQDQYGNYVTQHVLERGKPHEKSQIISKLAGQVVQMSQHKFASNVIEKCLEHGNTAEREHLIEEIVGQSEGNDNLLVMMKDQFANYVVQKILETSSDKQREVLVNRIKIHLQALKKYTYGKHIVARVEQLCVEEAHASE
ncbi:pumilio homolog 5-like isoform X1 [Phoenix dactylifera]|uniref:Pumilio homolog 5-like isoform X1 n=1 Tax=Phoenix dactylifera TaxID=42345 RepID=A0A8B7BPN9_PHODC|nr:pumilio homolog 5-like isoform X1 [Phoenix dactylifera]XP_008782801.2 pumilio homolog 5-like isoform X1 [Phoenix dactylifera]